MDRKQDILLNSHFPNKMKVNGEMGWFTRDFNPSTGYFWHYRPDESGVYEVVEAVYLHASTAAIGVPGMMVWKVNAVREGHGTILFELFPPTGSDPVETVAVAISVKN